MAQTEIWFCIRYLIWSAIIPAKWQGFGFFCFFGGLGMGGAGRAKSCFFTEIARWSREYRPRSWFFVCAMASARSIRWHRSREQRSYPKRFDIRLAKTKKTVANWVFMFWQNQNYVKIESLNVLASIEICQRQTIAKRRVKGPRQMQKMSATNATTLAKVVCISSG